MVEYAEPVIYWRFRAGQSAGWTAGRMVAGRKFELVTRCLDPWWWVVGFFQADLTGIPLFLGVSRRCLFGDTALCVLGKH